jgi:hypothetical protein
MTAPAAAPDVERLDAILRLTRLLLRIPALEPGCLYLARAAVERGGGAASAERFAWLLGAVLRLEPEAALGEPDPRARLDRAAGVLRVALEAYPGDERSGLAAYHRAAERQRPLSEFDPSPSDAPQAFARAVLHTAGTWAQKAHAVR